MTDRQDGHAQQRPPADSAAGMLPTLLAVPSIAVLQMALAISLGALVFAGPLGAGVGRAASGFLLGSAVVALVLGLASRMNCVIGGAQDTGAIIAAAVAASIAAEATATAAVPTVIMMLALAALITGVAMWVIGHFRLGSFVRVLPASVVGGFMAGTGWLLIRGGVDVMLGRAVHLRDVPDLFDWAQTKFLVLGVILGILMVAASRLPNSGVLVSIGLVVAVAGFHLVGRTVSSIGVLEADGWLIGPLPEDGGWTPVLPQDVADADWSIIGSQAVGILAIAAVSVIGLLLNLGGLESVMGEEIDLDHEFRITGPANLGVAAVGGIVGYHLIGDSLLARQLGVRSRRATLLVGALLLVSFLVGFELIGLVPRAVAGGVLIGLGLGLLVQWVEALRRSIDRVDVAVNVLILAAIAIFGVLVGVGVGTVCAALIFVYRYSRVDPVRHRVDAAGRSNVDRFQAERRVLSADPRRITALELQGYLFFGSVMRLRTHLEAEIDHTRSHDTTSWLILDLTRVTGVDSTAMGTFAAMVGRLADQQMTTLWSGVSDELAQALEHAGVALDSVHADLDHAIASAEDQLLAESPSAATDQIIDLKSTTSFAPASVGYPPALHAMLERRQAPAGTAVVELGDDGRDLFIVASGRLTAWAALEDGSRRRLRQIGAGSVIGELAFCTGEARTATVIADSEADLLVLTRARFEQLAVEDPDLAIAVQEWLLGRLSGRLAATSSMVRELMR